MGDRPDVACTNYGPRHFQAEAAREADPSSLFAATQSPAPPSAACRKRSGDCAAEAEASSTPNVSNGSSVTLEVPSGTARLFKGATSDDSAAAHSDSRSSSRGGAHQKEHQEAHGQAFQEETLHIKKHESCRPLRRERRSQKNHIDQSRSQQPHHEQQQQSREKSPEAACPKERERNERRRLSECSRGPSTNAAGGRLQQGHEASLQLSEERLQPDATREKQQQGQQQKSGGGFLPKPLDGSWCQDTTPAAPAASVSQRQRPARPDAAVKGADEEAMATALLSSLLGVCKGVRSSSSSSGSGSGSSCSSSTSADPFRYPSNPRLPTSRIRPPLLAPLQQQLQQQQPVYSQQLHFQPFDSQQRQQQNQQRQGDGGSLLQQSRFSVSRGLGTGRTMVPGEGRGGNAAMSPGAAATVAAAGSSQFTSQSASDSRQRPSIPLSASYGERQHALLELERHGRIPPPNACSQYPFPYLNAAAAAAAARAAEASSSQSASNEDSSSNTHQGSGGCKSAGFFGWLWRKSAGGSSSSQGGPDARSEGRTGRASDASAHSSGSGSSSSRLYRAAAAAASSSSQCSDNTGDQTAERPDMLLPKHLRLHLAMLLSRDDRLYYGETFASCVSHGCGFALYGGGVSRCGVGLWGKAALRRLGCGSLAGNCVWLPAFSRGASASAQAGGLGLPGQGSGDMRMADGLQTGLVLTKGPRPLAGYCGFWRLDRREGWGVLLRGASASKYEGQWVEDFRHGLGVQTLTQGCRYVGQFYMGQKHGKGVIVYPGGMMYAGEWAHGRICRQELLLSSRRFLPPTRRRRRRSAAATNKRTDESIAARGEHTEADSNSNRCAGTVWQKEQIQLQQQLLQQHQSRVRRRPTALRRAAAAVGITSDSSSSSSSSDGSLAGEDMDMEQRLTEQMEALREFSAASAVRHWGEEHVQCLLSSIGCPQRILQIMGEQQVDGPALLALTDTDLTELGVTEWEERRFLLLVVDLLLKLRHRHRLRGLYKAGWMARANLLQRILISPTEIDIEGPIGEGGYSRVYKATWRYTQSLDAQQRIGRIADAAEQQQQQQRHELQQQLQLQEQLWRLRSSSADCRHANHSDYRWDLPPGSSEYYEQRRDGRQHDRKKQEPSGEMSVAVKTFRQRDSNGVQRSLYAELSVLSLLRHPNVLLLLGVVGPPVYGLVTEYVSGGSLFDLLHKQRVSLPLMKVVKLAREVALGMSYLHEKGVMHCDLKSPNILLTNSGEVRLCDFGLATIVEAAGGPDWWTVTHEHQQQQQQQQHQQGPQAAHLGCVGTHHWMAPEILRGEPFTFAADVYSFGVVVWEMLVGDLPFSGIASASHLITVVGYGGVTPPLDKIPRPLRGFLKSCLQPEPSVRPTFAACAQLLQQLYTANLLDVEVDLNSLLGLGS